jgi:hypothetical protein
MTGLDVVAKAREYLGVRFKHQGRTMSGLDCVGFILRVGVDLGLLPIQILAVGEDALIPAYNHRPDSKLFALVSRYGDAVDEPRPGDVLILHLDTPEKRPEHIAIMTDKGMIHIHPGSSLSRVAEHSIDTEWRNRIIGAFRFRGLNG